jgi:hypothetical protein
MVRRWLWAVLSILFGTATAVAEFGYLAAAVVTGTRLDHWAVRLTEVELRRITRCHGPLRIDVLTPRRCRRYLAVRWLVGGLGAGVFLLLLLCVVVAGSMLSAWVFDGGWGLIENSQGSGRHLAGDRCRPAGHPGRGDHRRASAHRTRPARRRAATAGRAGHADRQGAPSRERRTARTPAGGVGAAREAISELREVAHRVYPAGLDDAGLHAAPESLAERSAVRVRLDYGLTDRLSPALETVSYFVISEAVTNAAKHAAPSCVAITVARQENRPVVTVADDGAGGADPTGSGLSGLARRVAAVDGRFSVRSPAGGPAVVEASLPCG